MKEVNAASPGGNPSDPAGNPEAWLDEHGDYLLRYALLRVRGHAVAEDLVQDTFLAALRARGDFRGGSSLRTWLTGILRFKIIDHYRRRQRETPFSHLDFHDAEERGSFDDRFHWRRDAELPGDWDSDRMIGLDREGFLKAYAACSGKLPPQVARIFAARELDDLKTEEICKIFEITPTNLFTILSRVRMALRRCLEQTWFNRHDARS
jgi:RNA polymerase sigma-70 factor (ECF subfamily)